MYMWRIKAIAEFRNSLQKGNSSNGGANLAVEMSNLHILMAYGSVKMKSSMLLILKMAAFRSSPRMGILSANGEPKGEIQAR